MKWWAIAVSAAALAFWGGAAAAAEPGALIGVRPLDAGERAVWATAGLPDFEFGAVFGQSSLSDIAGRMRLSYGDGQQIGGFGVAAAAVLRVSVANLQGWSVGLVSEPGVFVHSGAVNWAPLDKARAVHAGNLATNLFGVDLGLPALTIGRWLTTELHAAVGIAAPIRLHMTPEVTLELPFLLKIALEYAVAPKWSLLGGAEVGTSFYGPGAGQPAWATTARVRLGVGWRL